MKLHNRKYFLLQYIRDFVRGYYLSQKNFSAVVSCLFVWVNYCLCPFMLNICLFLLNKLFFWSSYRYITVILIIILYIWRGMVMWLQTYFQYSYYKCIVTQNTQRKWDHAVKVRQPRGGCKAANVSCTTVLLLTLCRKQSLIGQINVALES